MSESPKKGPLIKRKTKPMERPSPVVVKSSNDFKFSNASTSPTEEIEATIEASPEKVDAPIEKKEIETKPKDSKPKKKTSRRKGVVGKNNNVKSIKLPNDLHTKIGILGKFMDENKTYAIISKLVDYYEENELTDRQKKQIEYMTEFLNEDLTNSNIQK